MKYLMALLVASSMIFGLTACGGPAEKKDEEKAEHQMMDKAKPDNAHENNKAKEGEDTAKPAAEEAQQAPAAVATDAEDSKNDESSSSPAY